MSDARTLRNLERDINLALLKHERRVLGYFVPLVTLTLLAESEKIAAVGLAALGAFAVVRIVLLQRQIVRVLQEHHASFGDGQG